MERRREGEREKRREVRRENEGERENRRRSKEDKEVQGLTDTEGWQVVKRKKAAPQKNRSDVARSYLYIPKEAKRTTFFFTNFPDNFFAKHMLKAFLHYGDFEEVVIPAKRDKLGKRFGFAKAINVKEPEAFAVKLDNIIIGREKIMVNMSRFQRTPIDAQNPSHPKPKQNREHPLALNNPTKTISKP